MVTPKLVRYEAPGWGVGEVWLEGERVLWSELPRPSATRPSRTVRGQAPGHGLSGRLAAFFAGEADDFADVELELEDGFYGDCARALRAFRAARSSPTASSPRSPAAPAPRARPGTFCARNHLAPFVPVHRVVAAGGIGSFGSLGVEYKRRMLALEDVAL